MDHANITLAAEVALPIRDVTLEHLRTTAGNPVVVRCELVDELVLLEATKGLPGAVTPEVEAAAKSMDPTADAKAMMAVAPALLESGTGLMGPDGALLRPAFYAGPVAPHALCIPFRLLRVADVSKMVQAIMELGGYVGGAAAPGSFPDGIGNRAGAGAGVVDILQGGGQDAAGGAEGQG